MYAAPLLPGTRPVVSSHSMRMAPAFGVPLLVRKHVAADFLLLALDEVDVRQHAIRLEPVGQLSCDGLSV
jgi:hypothetical protein